jgi:ribosomal protein L40E
VPLPKRVGFAPGLIARTEPRHDGLLLCYFFAPLGTAEPTPSQLDGLRPADAVLVQRLDGLGPKWPRLGQADGWDRAVWPVPAFGRLVIKTGQAFLDIYDDDLRFVGQETADRAELDGLPRSTLLSSVVAGTTLANLLPKPSGAASARRGGRMVCVECGAKMRTARRCRRCGAPVPEHLRYGAPGTRAVRQQAAKPYKAVVGWTAGALLNIVALWIAIGFVVTAISEGSPAQEGPNYVPLWACAFIAIVCSIVPAVSVVILAGRRRERRAMASDSPKLLPESLA